MFGRRWKLRQLASYGEVLCFVSAWMLSLILAVSAERAQSERDNTRSFASTAEVIGMQAELRR